MKAPTRTSAREKARPEFELLLLCATPVRTARRSARIDALLRENLDWDLLQDLATWHRLDPLLYWELNAIRPEVVPPSLASFFAENMRNNLFLTGELFRVLDAFASEGIPVLPFKGPTLAAGIYDHLALRIFGDLDILVPPQHAWRARDLLAGEGYRNRIHLSRQLEADYVRSYDELTLYGPGGRPILELHWALMPPHFSVELDAARLWENTTEVVLGNRRVPTLGPENLLFAVGLHGAKHCWAHLGLVADMAWLIAKTSIDWEILLERARTAGFHRILLLGAQQASEVFEVSLPAPLADAINGDPAVSLIAEQILAASLGKRHDERAILRNGLMHMRMRERFGDRVRYASRLISRPGIEDWQMLKLPQALSFLYPVLRYPRLILKYRSKIE